MFNKNELINYERGDKAVKKLVVGLVLMLTLSLLAACGGGSGGGSQSASTPSSSPSTQQQQTQQPSSPAAQKPNYKFKLGHEANDTHVKHMTAEKFKEELEARSGGRMTVDIYPSRQLGTEAEMVQQVETGTLDFALISNGYMSSRSESMNGWFMPFMFENLSEAAEARQSEAAKQMMKDLEAQGLVGFDVFFVGNRHVLMKNTEVKTLDDLKGKKLRVPGSPVFQEFWNKIGAGPTPMPLPEVYTSLQTGVIDGIDVDLDALLSQKYYEISKYLILTNHMTFPEVAIGSKIVFDKLDAEDQQIVTEAMLAAVEWGVQKGIELESSRVEEAKAKGLTVTTLPDIAPFLPVAREIHDAYAEKNAVIKAFIEQNKK